MDAMIVPTNHNTDSILVVVADELCNVFMRHVISSFGILH